MSNRTTSLHRPLEGRWLAGVATGLGGRFGVPVWIIRIVFFLLCFAGGLGALLYVAGWLMIPNEGQSEAIVQSWVGSGQSRRWVGAGLVGLAVIILASRTGLIQVDLALAVVLIGVGVMLYRGDLGQRDTGPDDGRSKADTDGSSAQTTPPPTESEPEEPESSSPTPPPVRETSYLGRVTLGFAVLALGVLGLFDTVIPGFHPLFRHYLALLVAVIGAGLVIGAWFGRTGGLIVTGILLTPFLILSPLADVVDGRSSLELGWIDTKPSIHRITSVGEIRNQYDLDVGSLLIDLREVDFADRTVATEIEAGIGEVLVYLPDDVSVVVDGEVGIGSLRVNDWTRNGFGVETVVTVDGPEGELLIEAEVGIGQIMVVTWNRNGRQSWSESHQSGIERASHMFNKSRRGSDSHTDHLTHHFTDPYMGVIAVGKE